MSPKTPDEVGATPPAAQFDDLAAAVRWWLARSTS